MIAILLNGGVGTRMRPLTIRTPKSLLPVANLPFIHYQCEFLKRYGVRRIILALSYKAPHFKGIAEKIEEEGIKVDMAFERHPLGTAGAIKNCERFLKGVKGPIIAMNGDILADFDLHEIIAYHRKKSSYVTIALAKVSDVSAFGVVSLASDGRIIEFFEKPGSGETLDGPINAGLYVFSAQFLSEIPARRRVSIEREVFPRVISSGKGTFGYLHSGYWLDVGNIDNYLRANFDLIDGRLNTQIPDIRVERKCGGLCTIGKDVSIMPGVEICGHAVIGDGCVIGEETLIEDSVFLPGAKIGSRCRIFRSVVGRRTELGDNCIVTHAALADTSRIKPFSKLG